MNKKKIVKISAVVASVVVILVAGIVGVNAYIRHRNVVETGNLLGVEWYNETDPQFTITTVEQLYELAELSDFYNFKGQTIKLGADLVVNEGNAEDWAEEAPAKRWNPITGFAGTFDGQNHTISGLYGKGFERRMALFADTQMSCSVKNLSLTNSYFETTGHRGTASIVSHGGGKFKKIYSDAIIVHKGENVGGIASSIDVQSTFEECWFDGDIKITNRDCGGIIDEVLGARVTVKHCLFSGYIYSSYDVGGTRTGGIFGRTDKAATIVLSDSLSSGTIECEKTVYTGATLGASYNGVQFTIEDTYASTETYGTAIGESGKKGTFTGTPLLMSASELTGVKAYQWTTLNFDSYWAVVEDGAPILKCFAETVPSLEGIKKVYDISWYTPGGFDFTLMTREQLYGFFIVSAKTDYKDCKVKLGADIVVNEGDASKWAKEAPEMPWFPIATFAGQFDGQGHTISGLYTKTNSSYVGIFGQATAPSIIQNVSLKNSYFEKTGTSAAFMGSIAGDTYGIVQNIYSDAIIVSEGNQVGGIVGRLNDNDKTMSNMRIDGEDYSVMSNCWFDGSITMLAWEEENTGACEAGGLVGRVVQGDAIIEHCLNSGTISSNVTGRALMVGGLVGHVVNAGQLQITDCLSVGEIKTDYTICVGSVIGRGNTAERIITVKDTYATKESFEKAAISKNSLKATVKGDVICVDKSWIVGNKGYQFTTLDFDKYWTVVVAPDGTPILSQFASKKPSVKGLAKMVDTSWYKPDAKAMVIDSVADLYGLAMLSSTNNFEGKTIKLAADITVNPVDASVLSAWVNGTAAPENGWMTIGSSAKPFAGTFDGQGHTISGVYSVTDAQYNGLFGATTPTSMIKNLSLKDSYFAFTGNNLTEEGKEAAAYMGSIAGDLRGDMDSVYSNAIVTSTANQVGGLVGRANGAKDADGNLTTCTINNCWFDGQVILTGETARYAGGIAAVAVQGTIEITNCLNSGSVSNERNNAGQFLGGILGTEWTACTVNIEGCLNTGSITANYVNSIGSIIGRIQKKDSKINIADTYATKESCVNNADKPTTIGSRASGVKENGAAGTIYKDMLSGYGGYNYTMLDFDKYWTVVVNPDETPVLKTFADSTPSLEGKESIQNWYRSDAKTMEIDSIVDLYGLSILSEITDFAGQTVKLTQDLDLDPTVEWLPIGSTSKPFAGTFDGGMNTITGMYVDNTTAYIGMFAVTSPTSMVKNFYLEDSTFVYSGASLQYNEEKEKDEEVGAYMGSVVGDLRGDLDTVYSSATVKSVAMQVGGLVGRANGIKVDGTYTTSTINNCWFDGSVVLTGEVARYAGGLAGVAIQGNIEITNCLNTGTVSNERLDGGVFLGGFIGTDWGKSAIKISDSVSAGTITAPNVNCIGSIMGRVQKSGSDVVIENTYAMSGCCTKADGTTNVSVWSVVNGATVKNKTVVISESELLGIEAYKWTNLDFDPTTGKWVARKEALPRQRNFDKKSAEQSVAGVIKPDTSWYNKDETELYIGSEAELLGFAKLVNSGTTFKNQTVYLTKDLDMNPSWNDGDVNAPANVWVPIGQYTSAVFEGTFDGKYNGNIHSIKGIYCVSDKTDSSYMGLFGVAGSNSTIKNIILLNSYFEKTAGGGSNKVSAFMGSIAGELRGTMDTVYSEATVVSAYQQVGGLVGRANGLKVNGKYTTVHIKNCWYNEKEDEAGANGVHVTGANGIYAAGIVGVAVQGTTNIDSCLNTASVVSTEQETGGMYIGGIIGTDWTDNQTVVNITNCLNAGEVKADGAENYMGSVYGRINKAGSVYNIKNTYATQESFVKNSVDSNTGIVTINGGSAQAGGGKAGTLNGTAILKAQAEITGTKSYRNTLLDFYVNENDTGAWVARTNIVPALKAFAGTSVLPTNNVASLTGTEQDGWYSEDIDTYYIGTVSAFKAFQDYVNEGKTFSGMTVYLSDNMDLYPGWTAPKKVTDTVTGSPNWTPIGNNTNKFQGTFDGQGHEIKGVYASGSQYVGLFGYGSGVTLRDFRLTNSYIHATSSRVGSVVGCTTGNLSKIYSEALVVSSSTECGGLVGFYTGTTSDTISECCFAGTVQGSKQTGGIIGYIPMGTKTIENCLVSGNVITTNTLRNAQTGGLVGGLKDESDTEKKVTLHVISTLSVGTVSDGYTGTSSHQSGGVLGYRPENATATFENVYTTHGKGVGTQPTDKGVVAIEADIIKIANVNNIKGDVVYKDVSEGGLDLDYDVWVARTSDVPVPRCFVGTVVDKSAVAEDKTGRVYADTSWLSDNAGTEADPYQLDSAGDLLGFANEVNAGNTFQGKYIKLTADIDYNPGWSVALDETTGKLSGKAPKNTWIPIGSSAIKFAGTFDGQGHVIRGLYSVSEGTNADLNERIGLFGATQTGSLVKDLKLTNSYFYSEPALRSGTDNKGNPYTTSFSYMGSVVGELRGMLESVYSNAVVISTGQRVGGLVGYINAYDDATQTNTTVNIKNSWFKGQVRLSGSNGTYGGGIVGFVNRGTVNIVNALFSGEIVYKGTATSLNTGGILGSNNLAYNINLINCLSTGRLNVEGTANTTGSIVGNLNKSGSVLTVKNTYATNECFVKESTPTSYGNFATGTTHTNISKTSNLVAESLIKGDAANSSTGIDDLFIVAPFTGETEAKWTTLKVQENNQVKEMTPILKDFKAWWLDEHNYTKNLLMIGNSFSYYYVEELYGIAEATGIHLNIYNVYKSGCTLEEHWNWLQNDEKNYEFYVTNADGSRRALSGNVGLKECLAVADWDIISLQQASTTYIDTVDTAKALSEPYAHGLYGYLRDKFPNARYLWHQTWSSQIGYQHATDANNKVANRETQKLRDANAVGLANYICQTYNVDNVPSGSAWDIARENALIGDTLCNRVNASGADNTDNHHDGNVGGGQYLNACVWFETLTGKSCLGNAYRPADYNLSEEKIAILQQSAHEAVKAIYGETQ